MKGTIIIILAIATSIGLGIFVAGCDDLPKADTAKRELKLTEENQSRLLVSDPPPKLLESQERKNLVRRLKTFNVSNKISFIYLLTNYGQLVRFDTIKGKVSSVNSMLTATEQVIIGKWRDQGMVTIPSPDLDGSYGSNGDAIFWYNQDGAYCEWNGMYFLTDQPLKLTIKPLIVETTESD